MILRNYFFQIFEELVDSALLLRPCFFVCKKDCFARPISSAPDGWFDVVERYPNGDDKVLEWVLSLPVIFLLKIYSLMVTLREYKNINELFTTVIFVETRPKKKLFGKFWTPPITYVKCVTCLSIMNFSTQNQLAISGLA